MSAIVFKVGDVWHYRFQVAGQHVQRSTRLKNRRSAENLAQREYDAAVVRANGGQPVPTLDELAHDWVVMHRLEMYEPEDAGVRGLADILVRPQRSGALGSIQLRFDGSTCRFEL